MYPVMPEPVRTTAQGGLSTLPGRMGKQTEQDIGDDADGSPLASYRCEWELRGRVHFSIESGKVVIPGRV
jgi:hypothetical protein